MVAHHVSVMGVLATGARRALRRDPDAADEALATIEETGRTALREMRRLLDVLRTDAEPAGRAGAAARPGRPRGAGRAGPRGRPAGDAATSTGEPGRLDPGVALTVYRIVQEALTNALKHAGPGHGRGPAGFGAAGWLTSRSATPAAGPRAGRATDASGTACSACASGSRSTAARCAPGPARAAASGCTRGSRWSTDRRHRRRRAERGRRAGDGMTPARPVRRAARRRPAAAAHRVPDGARRASPTSTSSARPATAPRRSTWPGGCCPTWC